MGDLDMGEFCWFTAFTDNPHISQNYEDVSVHGWVEGYF